MPITQLDPQAALVVIDLQKGIVSMPTSHPARDVVARSAELARAFREKGLPVVLVNPAGRAPGRTDTGFPNFAFPPDWTDLVPELDQQPTDHLVTKQRFGAFIGTSLQEFLQQRGVLKSSWPASPRASASSQLRAAPTTTATTWFWLRMP
jgi:nicotinamidase-related amidase